MVICPRDTFVAVNTREVSSHKKGKVILFRLTDKSQIEYKETVSLPISCSGFFQAMKFSDYYSADNLVKFTENASDIIGDKREVQKTKEHGGRIDRKSSLVSLTYPVEQLRDFSILACLTSSNKSSLVSYLVSRSQTLLLPVIKEAGRFPSRIVKLGKSLAYGDQDGYVRTIKYI